MSSLADVKLLLTLSDETVMGYPSGLDNNNLVKKSSTDCSWGRTFETSQVHFSQIFCPTCHIIMEFDMTEELFCSHSTRHVNGPRNIGPSTNATPSRGLKQTCAIKSQVLLRVGDGLVTKFRANCPRRAIHSPEWTICDDVDSQGCAVHVIA